MLLQIRRRVDEQRERCRVALRETVVGESGQVLDDVSLHIRRDPPLRHPFAQRRLDRRHRLLRPLEPHRTAQHIRLPWGEPRHRHRDPHPLLLKERHAQRAMQDRLQRWMQERHRLLAASTANIRVDHVALDGAGPDDRHLHHQVVEVLRLDAR